MSGNSPQKWTYGRTALRSYGHDSHLCADARKGLPHAAATARNIVDSATIRGLRTGPMVVRPYRWGKK